MLVLYMRFDASYTFRLELATRSREDSATLERLVKIIPQSSPVDMAFAFVARTDVICCSVTSMMRDLSVQILQCYLSTRGESARHHFYR
jgi:hypothetical protein